MKQKSTKQLNEEFEKSGWLKAITQAANQVIRDMDGRCKHCHKDAPLNARCEDCYNE